MDLLEKVKHLIEDENYSSLESIKSNVLAKLGKCDLISTESQLIEDAQYSSPVKYRRTILVLML